MNKVFVINASPIILLGKAGLLTVISPLAESWIVPEGVVSEIEAKRPIDSYLSELAGTSKVSRESIEGINPLLAAWDLGQGESEVLTMAMLKPGAGVVLDDLQARKCAALFSLPVIGSLGLLVMAKRTGHIREIKPAFEKLIRAGLYIDRKILDRIYNKVGE